MLSIISSIIVIAFIVPMVFNMFMLIRSQRIHYYEYEIEQNAKIIEKKRIRTVVILFVLLPITLSLLFFGNYLLNK
jgi:hypothetical protein